MMSSYDESAIENFLHGELCKTIVHPGNGSSQTQGLKYNGGKEIKASTNEFMRCKGRNGFKALNVIYDLFIGPEIADVNLKPFATYSSCLNPINWIGSGVTYVSNWLNGFEFRSAIEASDESVVFHALNISEISIGQETDIESNKRKYDAWRQQAAEGEGVILWGISRGTAATFCAFAKYKYPEVRLVVLEGAIDSVENVIPARVKNVVKNDYLSNKITQGINATFSFFKKHNIMQYSSEGPSPLKAVDEFPENVPVVFITSEADDVVPSENTERIADALAARGKNDVYVLKLKRSSHPNYMFDDEEDRNTYEAFMHAIYRKYDLRHDPELADKGEHLLEECLRNRREYGNTARVA